MGVSAQQKMVVAGSYANNIIIIDRVSGEVEWSMDLPYSSSEGGECNSVGTTKEGNIFFSYKRGARMVDSQGETIWDFERGSDSEEVQSISSYKSGYMVAICGTPSRFVFLNKKGEQISETTYDLELPDSHSQFRQVRMSKKGTILIPVMGHGTLLEINRKGEKIQEIKIGGGAFSVSALSKTTALVSGGFGVKVVDLEKGEVEREVIKKSAAGVPLSFATEAMMLENGNVLVANWQGHSNTSDIQLIEMDKDGNKVFEFAQPEKIKYVSAFDFVK